MVEMVALEDLGIDESIAVIGPIELENVLIELDVLELDHCGIDESIAIRGPVILDDIVETGFTLEVEMDTKLCSLIDLDNNIGSARLMSRLFPINGNFTPGVCDDFRVFVQGIKGR
ncbi:hypothetical protein NHQ30_009444 [Ciborinia camelliae]|nr:hypothetical protein NHQ30_009444 [Ciborinia camelliae]